MQNEVHYIIYISYKCILTAKPFSKSNVFVTGWHDLTKISFKKRILHSKHIEFINPYLICIELTLILNKLFNVHNKLFMINKLYRKLSTGFKDLPAFLALLERSGLSSGGEEGWRSGWGSRLEVDCSWKDWDRPAGWPFLSKADSTSSRSTSVFDRSPPEPSKPLLMGSAG